MQITKVGDWGYDFSDLAYGPIPGGELACQPRTAIALVRGELNVGDYDMTQQNKNAQQVFGDTVLHVPGPIELEFPIPVWTLVIYLGSGVSNPERRCEMRCYAGPDDVADYVGGDSSHTSFGPIPESFQYMVCMIYPTAFPGYTPRPISRATFDPGGDDVFIGRIFAHSE